MVGLTYSLAGFEGSLCLSDQAGSLQLYYFVMGTMSISGAQYTHCDQIRQLSYQDTQQN